MIWSGTGTACSTASKGSRRRPRTRSPLKSCTRSTKCCVSRSSQTREAEAEDDVMGVADPEGTVGLENTSRRFQLPDVSLVIFLEPYRAHRVTTLYQAPLPGSFGRRRRV